MTSSRHHIPDRVGCLAAVGPHQKYQPSEQRPAWLDDEILALLLALNLERAGHVRGPQLP